MRKQELVNEDVQAQEHSCEQELLQKTDTESKILERVSGNYRFGTTNLKFSRRCGFP